MFLSRLSSSPEGLDIKIESYSLWANGLKLTDSVINQGNIEAVRKDSLMLSLTFLIFQVS